MLPRVLHLHPVDMWCIFHLPPFLHPSPHPVHHGSEDQRKVPEVQCSLQHRPQHRCHRVDRSACHQCGDPVHCVHQYSLSVTCVFYCLGCRHNLIGICLCGVPTLITINIVIICHLYFTILLLMLVWTDLAVVDLINKLCVSTVHSLCMHA